MVSAATVASEFAAKERAAAFLITSRCFKAKAADTFALMASFQHGSSSSGSTGLLVFRKLMGFNWYLTSSQKMTMIQFMRYPGGKGKTYQHVINLMPPHRVYIESHLGGGAVLRHKLPASRNIGIDVSRKVIASWAESENLGIELVCGRAEDFLSQFRFRGDELIYVDPPYHPDTRRQGRVYDFDYSVDDHERLLSLLVTLPCMIIISGYANDLYDDLLRDWQTINFYAKTHADVREETLWFNFELPSVLHDSRYLGVDFRERQATKRRLSRLQSKFKDMAPLERSAFAQWLNQEYQHEFGSNQ